MAVKKMEDLSERELRTLKRNISALQASYEELGFNNRVSYIMSAAHFGYKNICRGEILEEREANRMLLEETEDVVAEMTMAENAESLNTVSL